MKDFGVETVRKNVIANMIVFVINSMDRANVKKGILAIGASRNVRLIDMD